jgi:hypothetical protein
MYAVLYLLPYPHVRIEWIATTQGFFLRPAQQILPGSKLCFAVRRKGLLVQIALNQFARQVERSLAVSFVDVVRILTILQTEFVGPRLRRYTPTICIFCAGEDCHKPPTTTVAGARRSGHNVLRLGVLRASGMVEIVRHCWYCIKWYRRCQYKSPRCGSNAHKPE